MTGANVTIPGVVNATEIGRGGFGVVYRATEEDLGRDVAVKILSGELDERTRTRFERERRAMGTLSSHPNIITIFRSGTAENGGLYLVMEYLPGGSLADHIVSNGPTGWEDTVRIGVELCGALESAHRAGVLHRDVKPGNIMLDNLGRSKLGDFGIARLDGSPETKSAVITASVAHAPPEVIAGEKPDERSDVYSLASTLFELTSGAPAFVRPTDESMIPMFARIVHEPTPDLRQRGVPDAVASVFEKAMSKQADGRFGSAAEFGRALIEVQRNLGVSETRLWIEGEPAAEPPTGQHTQIVAPPNSGDQNQPVTGQANLAPSPPTQPPGPAPNYAQPQEYSQPAAHQQPYPQQQPGPDQRSSPPPPTGPSHAPQHPNQYQNSQALNPQPNSSQPMAPYQQPGGPQGQAGPPPQQFAAPQGHNTQQPATGYVPPPGQAGYGQAPQNYGQGPAPIAGGPPGQAPGQGSQGSRFGLIIAAVVGAVVLIAGVAVAASNGDDPEDATPLISGSDLTDSSDDGTVTTTTTTVESTTTTTEPTTTTTAPPDTVGPRPELLSDLPGLPSVESPYTEYRAVGDADLAFTLQVPVEWVDTLPTEGQVIVSPDNNAALADELISGVVVSGTQGVGAWDADFFLDELLKSLADPDAPCSPVKREPYDDGVFDGLIYAELCGGGDLLVVDIIVANPNRDAVIFIGMQMTDERDIAAFEKVLDTFFLKDPALLPPVE